ncbi:MAG: TIGR02996 domain-containing protein [Gemmataceae bacterium]|nr:TIGR02996 domain-containing protein [Gemmataceae bacterium]
MSGLYQHPQVLALLQAAREQPEDDGPRLVLADWLEEAGDAHRAEFLRLQCALGPGPGWPDESARSRARERVAELLARFGGAWLDPLWQHGGVWHRGLLSVELDRLRVPDGLGEMLPWIDTLHFEVPGRVALRWAVALTARASPNHVTLRLRRPFPADVLLDLLGEAMPSSCLCTLTFRWPPGTGLRTDEGVLINLPDDFFARLTALPLGRHLTHLGSIFLLGEGQVRVLRAAGIEPVLVLDPHWPHALPLPDLRQRRVALRVSLPRSS